MCDGSPWQPSWGHLRPDVWLLVLLSSDSVSMAEASCCCQGFHLRLAWRKGEVLAMSHVAARLRSGLGLAEEVLGCEIGLPEGLRSWMQLLHQQEQGAWLCILRVGERVELVADICDALVRAEQVQGDAKILIALLPSAQQHVSDDLCIQKAVKICGLGEPATLVVKSLEVKVEGEDPVELQNCVLCGQGTQESRPRGIGDCVLRVAAGSCCVSSCQLRIVGRSGFGVVVGPQPTRAQLAPPAQPPRLALRATEIEASTGCCCFMGGELCLEGVTLRDCQVGVSVCDQGSVAFLNKLDIFCREGGRRIEQVSGGLVVHRDDPMS